MDDFADKDGCLFHFRQLSEFTCSSLKKCINIQRLPEASGEPANGLFLFGALGGILKQPDIVNCQANLIRHIEDKLLVYFAPGRSEEHTSELQSRLHLVCRLLLEKKKT